MPKRLRNGCPPLTYTYIRLDFFLRLSTVFKGFELDIWSHIGCFSQNAEHFCSLNWPLIVRIRVPAYCVKTENLVFYMIFIAWNEIAHCATTLHWQQSCWASDIFISCEKNHIKNMIFDIHTARLDTYPHNGRDACSYNSAFVRWTKSLMHFCKDVGGQTSNIKDEVTLTFVHDNIETCL